MYLYSAAWVLLASYLYTLIDTYYNKVILSTNVIKSKNFCISFNCCQTSVFYAMHVHIQGWNGLKRPDFDIPQRKNCKANSEKRTT